MSDEQDQKTEETEVERTDEQAAPAGSQEPVDTPPVHGPVNAGQDTPVLDEGRYGDAEADKAEAEPEDEDKHPLAAAREEGSRVFPTWQTGNIDTSTGGLVDLKSVSPVFEHTRQDLVRHAADVFDPDTDTADENVFLPEDKDEADAVKEQTAKEAASLPERSYFGDEGREPAAEENAAQEPAQAEEAKPENG